MPFYAHTLEGQTKENWEPLFTPFGDGPEDCQRDTCQKPPSRNQKSTKILLPTRIIESF
jgi:hypothetical protein